MEDEEGRRVGTTITENASRQKAAEKSQSKGEVFQYDQIPVDHKGITRYRNFGADGRNCDGWYF